MAYFAKQEAIVERDRATELQKVAEAQREKAEDNARKLEVMMEITKRLGGMIEGAAKFPQSRRSPRAQMFPFVAV